jgi:hypothetical protein
MHAQNRKLIGSQAVIELLFIIRFYAFSYSAFCLSKIFRPSSHERATFTFHLANSRAKG